jgi:hypothetical protein
MEGGRGGRGREVGVERREGGKETKACSMKPTIDE